jgi:hypothetical protein
MSLLEILIVILLALIFVMLIFINENLARIVTEMSWFGKRAEKQDEERRGN